MSEELQEGFESLSMPDPAPGITRIQVIRHSLGTCIPEDNCPLCG